ncbi:MAG: tail fiber domain-containing protein [Flavobacteriales bacterium]|nr:tail fiber domain-containing protein [Flavobacteriales bacterium]
MKNHILFTATLLVSLFISSNIWGQTPAGINYQAAARDAQGNIMSNKSLTVKAVIATGSSGSNLEYSETHSVTTNEFGLFNIIIGQGSSTDNFGALSWGQKKHHLKVEIDAGSGLVSMGTVAFEAVPYALSAKNVENIPTIDLGDLNDVNTSGATNGQVLQWNGTNWVPANASGGTTLTAGNGLAITGSTISANSSNPMWNADKLQGSAVSNTSPSNGEVLKWNGSNWAPATDNNSSYTAGSGIGISGGVISANNTNSMWNANQLQGNSINSASPSTGQVLKWNGTAWNPDTDNGTSYTAGTGINITGSVISSSNTSALWNANQLQGRSISNTTPTSGQVLQWNGSTWTFATLSSGSTSLWTPIGTQLMNTHRNVAIGKDTAASALDIIDTITSTGSSNYPTMELQCLGSATNTTSNYGLWLGTTGRGGYQNVGIRTWAGDSATSTYTSGGATGIYSLAVGRGGSNNFGVRAFAGPGSITRSYAIYSESKGDASFNMGIFAYCSGAHNLSTKTNYGIYAWADSAQTNYAGYFSGNVTYTGTLASASDERLKENILPLQSALQKVLDVEVATYTYKSTPTTQKMGLPKGQQIGFIAQDLEKSFPLLVENQIHALGAESPEGMNNDNHAESVEYKAVNYIGMIPVLTRAIQEQQDYIKQLEKRLVELEAKMGK